jgi:MarR family transcriptional regulator, transcriptional regulator for hemolysin
MRGYDFQDSIGFIINRTAKALVKALDSELRERVGISFSQWKVIVMLMNENGLTQKDIADRLAVEGATLIPIIDKMQQEGFLIRKVDSTDRRNNRLYLTEKAGIKWNAMIHCALKIREISVKEIPEGEIKVMRKVLEKMWNNLGIYMHTDSESVKTGKISNLSERSHKGRKLIA